MVACYVAQWLYGSGDSFLVGITTRTKHSFGNFRSLFVANKDMPKPDKSFSGLLLSFLSTMDVNVNPTYPLFSVFALLSFFFVLIPLPWHIQAWNVGTCAYIIWASVACLFEFINSIIWRNNALNLAPVWCDICIYIQLSVRPFLIPSQLQRFSLVPVWGFLRPVFVSADGCTLFLPSSRLS